MRRQLHIIKGGKFGQVRVIFESICRFIMENIFLLALKRFKIFAIFNDYKSVLWIHPILNGSGPDLDPYPIKISSSR